MKETLLSSLRTHCMQLGLDKTYWIAYSGGLDSHVLLSLCSILRTQLTINFRVLHVNHTLSPHALAWTAHCQKVCEDHAMDFFVHTLNLEIKPGDSLEEIAREKRYAFFAECLNAGDVLLTAHHQDDQAETVLLQLLRGAGLKGLAAMPVIKPFAQGFHCRPFIQYARACLQAYANTQQLKWVDDESNTNIQFTRNFIRHEIVTTLKSRWPSATATIARSAVHCSESQDLLEEWAVMLCFENKGSSNNTLSVAKLTQLSEGKQRLVLRQWIQQLGFPLPDSRKIKTIQQDVLTAAWDSMPCVSWGSAEMRRYRDDLYLMHALPEHDTQQHYAWDFIQPLYITGVGQLRATQVLGKGLRAGLAPLSVRFRQGGETVDVPNRGRHTLKNLFQEWKVLPWERDRIPLLFAGEQLIGVVGHFIAAHVSAKSDELGHEICLERAVMANAAKQ